jgi:hypothetical protein
MLFNKPLILGIIVGSLPVTAQAWEHSIERGVDLYQTLDGAVSVSMVCDPNTVYGTTVSAVMVGVGPELDMSVPVTFRFPDLISIQATLDHGRISKADNADGAWEPLLTGFRTHNAVAVSVGDESYDVKLGDPMPFSCL